MRNRTALREALDRALSTLGGERIAPSDLPTMPADEVLLGYDRVAEDWLGFAWGRGELRTVRLKPGAIDQPPAALSDWLLAPFKKELDAFRARPHRGAQRAAAGRLSRAPDWAGSP